ncbi:Ebp2-domain-containing protein [Myriangium duriaei CBS 260.36]|uniref:Ebp2-domain-containing protein n=1 Tax=Myriangium duriaei CBS 260.36 TaxID=1168546 RepID=A0A9P4J8D5_9PEZI|nr:Ebp2-domain-containing protein [Myriangium duriaei CBS 260.36]
MAKRAKLKDALDHHQGIDRKKQHALKVQKDAQKKAQKRKREYAEEVAENVEGEVQPDAGMPKDELALAVAKDSKRTKRQKKAEEPAAELLEVEAEEDDDDDDEEEDDDSEGWETADEDFSKSGIDLARLQDSDSDDDSESDDGAPLAEVGGEDEEDEDDIALSDIESLASEEKADVIPHQRLTINNTAALTRAYKSIALPSSLPFSATQAVVSATPTEIKDIDDDLSRELAFYKQSLDAVTQARALLKSEGVPFSRPVDYFAEMVKSDEHMGKIKKKLVDDAAGKKAAADARRQRDLKKFGKQVQVAKLQERDKAKRETLDKIKMLKKKRSGADITNATEDDMFDVALEDAAETARKDKADRRAAGADGARNAKRQKKNEKYGFGGKKRFSKSNDAASSADMRGFSTKKMKGKGKPTRPGKARRASKMG